MRSTALLATSLAWFSLIACGEQGPGVSADPEGLAGSPAPSQRVIPDQYIVLFGPGAGDARAAAQELARAHGFAPRHVFTTAVRGFVATLPPQAVAAISANPNVERVEPEEIRELIAQTLPEGIDRIETDRSPSADVDSTDDVRVNLDVAVIDTGVMLGHADLNVAGGQNFTSGPADAYGDSNGHGTHVSGTIGALDNGIGVVGVAPGARIWAVKVCKSFCFTGDMVAGIDWVAARKADRTIDFASANMSISTSDEGTPCSGSSGAVHRAICGVVNRGVLFAMAAGNDGRLKTAYPEAFTVSAIADFDGRGGGLGSPTCRSDTDDTLANFSNYGPTIDIAAPGVCILSTWNDGAYATISGTSMASPHAAGAAALYLHATGAAPARDGAGVRAIENALTSAALPQAHACGFTHERASSGSDEPLLFVNAASFGGDGTCDAGTGAPPPPPPPPGAAPVVSSCTPSSGAAGASLVVAVAGSDLQAGAQVSFGTRVAVQSVTFVSASRLDVQIKVHPRASSGPRTVSVTNPDGQSGQLAGCFSVL